MQNLQKKHNPKRCKKCNTEKAISEFYFRKDTNKHRNECKACVIKINNNRELNNPVRLRLQRANVSARKKTKKNNLYFEVFSVKRMIAQLEAQMYLCNICQKDIQKTFCVDHIIPFALKGGHYLSNIQFLCKKCNASKEKHLKNSKGQFTGKLLRKSNRSLLERISTHALGMEL